ncbi:ROK family transcriptional regulator [Nocardioides limicola]|uniref:ROK family transcriptional regulator n=1 Tax=Nocardioides limicola TaxID=2803368 RepID=UPI00193C309E|nr:ROK family transcriptional regulator [Nocardioides sp. DJM-14]
MPSSHEPRPGSTASLRSANTQRILQALRDPARDHETAYTQAELARLTGLAPATVSGIVRSLAETGLADTVPGSGRRGTEVRLARSAGLVVGLDFGRLHLSVALGDLAGRIVAEDRQPLGPDVDHSNGLALAHAKVAELLEQHGATLEDVRTVTIGLPAPVTAGQVRSSTILPGWLGVNARDATAAQFGTHAHAENDANLGALAEHRVGAARGHRTSAFVKISSGVGAGLIIDDRLFRGSDGTAGEMGHLTLDTQGPVCRCGSRGCLETYASIGTVVGLLAERMPGATFADVVEAAREGQVGPLRALEDAGLHLGWGLASVANLLNPTILVVGGEMARAGELLLSSVRIGLRRHSLDAVAATPVVTGELGDRASLVGAVLLAAERTELAVDLVA